METSFSMTLERLKQLQPRLSQLSAFNLMDPLYYVEGELVPTLVGDLKINDALLQELEPYVGWATLERLLETSLYRITHNGGLELVREMSSEDSIQTSLVANRARTYALYYRARFIKWVVDYYPLSLAEPDEPQPVIGHA